MSSILISFFIFVIFFFFKQKTAYEIYQCDWSSDVCSSDLYGFDDVKFQEFEVDAWSRGTVSLTITNGNTTANIPVVSLGHSPTKASVSAQIIDMGNGLVEDYENIGEIGRASCRERV